MSDVSVVMATYNGARHVREQFRTILDQTEPPAEIVVCDDGSTDDTVAIAREIAAISPVPIRVHQNERNLGFSDNFLRAATLSRQPYIAFCDQDDRWHPEKLAKSRAALDAHGAVMCTHQVVLMTESGEPIRLDPQLITETTVVEPHTVEPFGLYFGFAMMIDRRLLDLLPGERRGLDSYTATKVLPHDRWVYFLATTFGRSVTLAEPLAHYRQHATQSYGVRPVSLPQRVRNKIDEGSAKLHFLATLADERAALIEECTPGPGGSFPERTAWCSAALRWSRVAEHYHRRTELHLTPHLGRRLGILLANWRCGTYAQLRNGGLGRKRFLEDVTVGLVGPTGR